MKVVAPIIGFDWNLLFSLITFLVLFLILKHFFFEKVHNFMEERSQEVQDTLDNAAQTNADADERLALYNAKLKTADDEGREIIKNARKEADIQADTIINEAREKSDKLLKRSQEEIRREQYDARKKLKDEVGDLAALAAGQILEREISADEHRDIIDKIIEEAEERPWN